jgi:hypothetical protein
VKSVFADGWLWKWWLMDYSDFFFLFQTILRYSLAKSSSLACTLFFYRVIPRQLYQAMTPMVTHDDFSRLRFSQESAKKNEIWAFRQKFLSENHKYCMENMLFDCAQNCQITYGSFHANSTRPWHPWSRTCLIIFYS